MVLWIENSETADVVLVDHLFTKNVWGGTSKINTGYRQEARKRTLQ